MSSTIQNLPPQQLPFSRKNKEWRKKHLDWADNKTFSNSSLVRKDVITKTINYDLVLGKLHMKDLERIINPNEIRGDEIPNRIAHYPIINSKLNLLIGEESSRIFDFRVVVTNPNSISDIEEDKKSAVLERLKSLVEDTAQSEDEYNVELTKLNDYFSYEYQDMREVRANCILNHYIKELNIPLLFSNGFMDALVCGEEIYQCDVVGGEPIIERLNPMKVRVYRSGFSNKIEDADMIVLEDYWSPGRIIDTFYEEFSCLNNKEKQNLQKLLENLATSSATVDSMDNEDPRSGFVNSKALGLTPTEDGSYFDPFGAFNNIDLASSMPYDIAGNVRVLRVYWKSRRKIKKVKSYNKETGEEEYNFYPETYICDETMGEEETVFWINEAWEGTKIGDGIYVGMRPRIIQYNRLSNPSRCHFGIVGSIYNVNENRPYSMVDMMKPYNYLYDIIHDRLNKLIAKNWGNLIRLDLAKVPRGWDVKKWLHYAKTLGIAVEDSFKEGQYGSATGKLAGGMNNASSGVIPAELGNVIQQYTNLLEYIKMEMGDVIGISKQREGQVQNRETVGGVERATLQSSHITEWLFFIHEDVKKRALECFLETAKIAMRGKTKKFSYIIPGFTTQIQNIDGDVFAESDYGLVLDNSNATQQLNQKIDMLAQAALQNQALSFSTIMKLYSSCSIAEKMKTVEINEQRMQEQAQQAQQQEQQMQQMQLEQQAQFEQARMEQEYTIASEKNETAILVAEINSQAEADRLALMNQDTEETYTEKDKAELSEKIRQFDAKLKLDTDKFNFEREKTKKDQELKLKQINKASVKSKSK